MKKDIQRPLNYSITKQFEQKKDMLKPTFLKHSCGISYLLTDQVLQVASSLI